MKDQFYNDTITVTYTYQNSDGTLVEHKERVTVNNEEGFPREVDAVFGSAEAFLKSIGAMNSNEYLLSEILTDDELEAVVGAVSELRGDNSHTTRGEEE